MAAKASRYSLEPLISPQATDAQKTVGLTAADVAEIRQMADSDVFYFGTVICQHRDLVFVDHAPPMYMAAGQADRLLAVLRSETLDSFTIRQIRKEAERHGVDIWAEDAAGRLAEKLRVIDERLYRRSGKSSGLTHTVRTWKMTRDPNLSSALITNTDEKAKDFCKQIRATILSDLYKAVYPDRVPADLDILTENRLTLAGRTVPDMEPCLMAFGVKSSPTGYHFDELHFDDLVGRENKSAAELTVVSEFLANLTGLRKPGIRYPVRRIHVGTRWDDDDDSSLVRLYANCFALTVPIWVRSAPSDDLTIPGDPTTAWYPLEKILAEQEEVLSNPDEGPISWRCNYELDPTIAGGRIFPAQLVDQAEWIPYKGADGKTWPAREIRDEKTGQPVMVKDGEREKRKALAFDPAKLYVVTCVDQSFSEDGDEWAVVTVGMDQYTHRYELESTVGHGVEAMLDAADMARTKLKPRRIGMEKIAAQHVIELVLKLGTKYRWLRPLVEPISHGNKPKEWRIRNGVAEVLKMRRLHLNPYETRVKDEMKKYKPGPKAKDNILDALAMCEVLIQKSMQPKEDEEDYKKKFARRNQAIQRRRDSATGVPLW